jgi:multiple sugar transport system permease protein/raffinose/stachyose/melibiose transport system permease protein
MLRTSTVVYQIYLRAFEDFQMGYAATQSVALLVIVLLVTLANFKAIAKRGVG